MRSSITFGNYLVHRLKKISLIQQCRPYNVNVNNGLETTAPTFTFQKLPSSQKPNSTVTYKPSIKSSSFTQKSASPSFISNSTAQSHDKEENWGYSANFGSWEDKSVESQDDPTNLDMSYQESNGYRSHSTPHIQKNISYTTTKGNSLPSSSSASFSPSNSVSDQSSTDWKKKFPFPEELNTDYNLQSFNNAGRQSFPEKVLEILNKPLSSSDIEIKPDGVIYLPEIKYRQILFKAFGPGGWALLPRGPHTLNGDILSREYILICAGQFVSIARGSAIVRSHSSPAVSSEAARSNALMRCCKDLGIAHELWNPDFIRQWKAEFAEKKNVPGFGGKPQTIYIKKMSNHSSSVPSS